MRSPYGLNIVENCVGCELRTERFFCQFSPAALHDFGQSAQLSTYPADAQLFVEGQAPRGIFLLCSGRVKLSTMSQDGKSLILKIAEVGEPLGLSAAISGRSFEVTAETITPCQVRFVSRADLMRLLERHGEASLNAARALSDEYQSTCDEIRSYALAPSSAAKMARLLLSWCAQNGHNGHGGEIRLHPGLTHEEIAQMINVSRETVTRVFTQFRRKHLVEARGSMLIIRNKAGLEKIAQ